MTPFARTGVYRFFALCAFGAEKALHFGWLLHAGA
jgi:hypothetical protein